DEEDRELALTLLGAKPKPAADEMPQKASKAKGGQAQRPASARGPAASGPVTGPAPGPGRAPAQQGRPRPASAAPAARGEAIAQATSSEQAALGDDDPAETAAERAALSLQMSLTGLDLLTGSPRPDDVFTGCLPVCAPYSTLQGYKFRVKLTPGAQRKGRAGKQALELFQHLAEATAEERAVMETVKDADLQGMLANVKISMPGLEKMKSAAKKAKKHAK
ncbi:hypothetical protein CYMTET_9236, partial [Cymbomonas tetramitiformis]